MESRFNDGVEGYWVTGQLRLWDGCDGFDTSDEPISLAVAIGWAPTLEEAEAAASARRARRRGRAAAPVALTGRLISDEGPQLPPRGADPQTMTRMSPAALLGQWHDVERSTVYRPYLVVGRGADGAHDDLVAARPAEGSGVNWLNIFYAVEWAVFAGFAFYLWYRLAKRRVGAARSRTLEDAEAGPDARTASPDPRVDWSHAPRPQARLVPGDPRSPEVLPGLLDHHRHVLLLLVAEMIAEVPPLGVRALPRRLGRLPVVRSRSLEGPERAASLDRRRLQPVARASSSPTAGSTSCTCSRASASGASCAGRSGASSCSPGRHRPAPLLLHGGQRRRARSSPTCRAARTPSCTPGRPLLPDPRDPDGEPAVTEQTETSQRPVLVVDFGAQYAQLIARRVREAGVYSEIVPHTASAAEIAAKNPVGIILSGGPSSVYEPGAPALDPGVFDLGVPTLGICYGFQVMAQALGGEVANTGLREYGATDAALTGDGGVLLGGQPADQNVWMSHGDQVAQGARGLRRARLDLRHARRRVRQRRAPAVRRAVAPRGQALRLRPAGHRELPPQGRGPRRRLEQRQRHRRAGRAHPRAGRLRPRHLRAVGRRRLRRRRRARARGRRRPARLHLRRPRPAAQGRARAGRAGLRRLDRRAPRHRRRARAVPHRARRASATPSRSARSSAASSSASFEAAEARRSSPRRPPTASRSASSCRARSTPTSSSPAAAPAPRTSSRTTTSAAFPKTSSSSSSSRCAPCSRTRSARSAASSACPR